MEHKKICDMTPTEFEASVSCQALPILTLQFIRPVKNDLILMLLTP